MKGWPTRSTPKATTAGRWVHYREGLAIHRRLAAQDPTNTDWQSDLFVAQLKVGDTLRTQGDADGALQQFADALAIAQQLVDLDATNADWQRNFASAYERIGQALLKKNDAAGALKAYEDSLDVRRRLAAQDPANLDRRHDVFVGWTQVGDARALARAWPLALTAFRDEALPIQRQLVEGDPTNAAGRADLAETEDKVGAVLEAQENVAEAVPMYREALAGYEGLVAQSPADRSSRVSAAVTAVHLGRALLKAGTAPLAEARAALERGCGALRKLREEDGRPEKVEEDALAQGEGLLRSSKP